MQTGSGASAARLPTVITAIAVVLAVIGLGGVVTGAADKPSDKVASSAGSTTTTTEVPTTLAAGATTSTSVAVGGSATTIRGATTTTAKSTPTTAPVDCPAPATDANPGASKPPAVGTYEYVTCDGKESSDKRVESYPGDAKRRLITEDAAGFEQTSTVFWGPNGVFAESFTIGGAFTCDWRPDLLEWPATVSVGTTFSVDSSCTIATPLGPATIRLTGTATVTGKVQMTIGGVTANVWSVNSKARLMTHSKDKDGNDVDQNVDIMSTTYFEPERGIDLYRHIESKGQQEDVVIIERLKSLTPKKNS